MSFSHQRKLMLSHRSLSGSKSPQVSRALLSILADFNNAVVWMVSTRPLISKSSSPYTNPITISIAVTFIFHSFSVSSKVKTVISIVAFFQFYFNYCELFLISLSSWSFAWVWVKLVSLGLLDSSPYFCRSYCGSLDVLVSSSNFHFTSPNLWGPFKVHQLQFVLPSLLSLTFLSRPARSQIFDLLLLSIIFYGPQVQQWL